VVGGGFGGVKTALSLPINQGSLFNSSQTPTLSITAHYTDRPSDTTDEVVIP
jgi:hypothetical protein